MEVSPNIESKGRRHITPVKSEDQIIPAAAILKRGRLDLGVVLCIRGNKVHYYSFISQGKVAVFEDWLFKMPVKLGQRPVEDFSHLKKLLKENFVREKKTKKDVPPSFNIRNVFSKIEATTLSNCINSNTCTILKHLDEAIIEIKESNNSAFNRMEMKISNKTRHIQERIENLAAEIFAIQVQLEKLRDNNFRSGNEQYYNEFHVTNSLNFQDCYFEQPVEEFRSPTFKEPQQQSAASDDEDPTPESKDHDSTTDEACVSIFRINSVIKEHHWKKFLNYYRRYSIIDVYFSELQWMRDTGMSELIERVAPYVMGNDPPIKYSSVEESLRILFDILRTSRIRR